MTEVQTSVFIRCRFSATLLLIPLIRCDGEHVHVAFVAGIRLTGGQFALHKIVDRSIIPEPQGVVDDLRPPDISPSFLDDDTAQTPLTQVALLISTAEIPGQLLHNSGPECGNYFRVDLSEGAAAGTKKSSGIAITGSGVQIPSSKLFVSAQSGIDSL